jgi:predicted RNA-binding Zn-ribbon protein involved in translation (DUF1610 family)
MSQKERDAFKPGRVKEIIAEYRGRYKVVGEYLALKELAVALSRAESMAKPDEKPAQEPVDSSDVSLDADLWENKSTPKKWRCGHTFLYDELVNGKYCPVCGAEGSREDAPPKVPRRYPCACGWSGEASQFLYHRKNPTDRCGPMVEITDAKEAT